MYDVNNKMLTLIERETLLFLYYINDWVTKRGIFLLAFARLRPVIEKSKLTFY